MPTIPSTAPATAPAKPWYASRTVWGGALAVAAPLLGRWGIPLGEGDIADLSALLGDLGGIVGGLLALYGRARATHALTR